MIQVLLVEWMGYPLFRRKTIGKNTIDCGLAPLLRAMNRFEPGIDFECTIIVNEHQNKSPHPIVSKINKYSFLKPFLINNISTNCEEKYNRLSSKYNFVKRILYRSNLNQDIGAYDCFYENLRNHKYQGQVLFLNSSVRGPKQDGWLIKYKKLFDLEPDTGLCGISLICDRKLLIPHIQSFCLYTSMDILEKVFPTGFLPDEYRNQQLSKDDLVMKGEVEISSRVLQSGYGLRCTTFPDFYYKDDDRQWTIPYGDIRFQEEYCHLANQC